MSRSLQTATTVLLLVLVPVLGQAGVLQCLCSGQFSSPAFAVQSDEHCCCDKEPPPACTDCSHDGEQPAPCGEEGGNCWVVISIDAVEASPLQLPSVPEVAICPPSFGPPTSSPSPQLQQHPFPGLSPPPGGSTPPPLTVLFSSFLI